MPSDINRVILIGRLVKDPELKYIQSGSSVASFGLANNRTYTTGSGEKKEVTSFFNCIAWGKQGEVITQYCKKGQRIAVEGRLQSRSWDDQSGNKRKVVEIVVESFQFLTAKPGAAEGGETAESAPGPGFAGNQEGGEGSFSDDDIPF
jgi:single-strand DNA-binding protein